MSPCSRTLLALAVGLPAVAGPGAWATLATPTMVPVASVVRPSPAQVTAARALLAKAQPARHLSQEAGVHLRQRQLDLDRAQQALVVDSKAGPAVLVQVPEGKWVAWLAYRLGAGSKVMDEVEVKVPGEGRLWVQHRMAFIASEATEDDGAFWTVDLVTLQVAGPGVGPKMPCESMDPPFVFSSDGNRLAVLACDPPGRLVVWLYHSSTARTGWRQSARWTLPRGAIGVAFRDTRTLLALDPKGIARWGRKVQP